MAAVFNQGFCRQLQFRVRALETPPPPQKALISQVNDPPVLQESAHANAQLLQHLPQQDDSHYLSWIRHCTSELRTSLAVSYGRVKADTVVATGIGGGVVGGVAGMVLAVAQYVNPLQMGCVGFLMGSFAGGFAGWAWDSGTTMPLKRASTSNSSSFRQEYLESISLAGVGWAP